jgi:hypothetical protein
VLSLAADTVNNKNLWKKMKQVSKDAERWLTNTLLIKLDEVNESPGKAMPKEHVTVIKQNLNTFTMDNRRH